jgi:hypothetical protein
MYGGGYKKIYKFCHSKRRICWNFKSCWYARQRALSCSRSRDSKHVLSSEYTWRYNTVTRLGKTGLAGQPKPFVATESVGGLLSRCAIILHDRVRPHTMQHARKHAAKFSVRERFGLSLIHPGFSNEPFQFVSRHEGTFVRISLRLRRRRQTCCRHVVDAAETSAVWVRDGHT